MTDDDGLHSVDSVRADNLCTYRDPELTAVGAGAVQDIPPEPPRSPRIGRTQDDENAVAALQSTDSGGARGAAIAGDNEIDRSDHGVRLGGSGSLTTMGPLSVRKNASICRSSTGFIRSGRNSL